MKGLGSERIGSYKGKDGGFKLDSGSPDLPPRVIKTPASIDKRNSIRSGEFGNLKGFGYGRVSKYERSGREDRGNSSNIVYYSLNSENNGFEVPKPVLPGVQPKFESQYPNTSKKSSLLARRRL